MKSRLQKQTRKQRGLTLVEVMIAATIVVTTLLVLSTYVINFKTRSRVLEGSDSCRSRAQVMIDAFKNIDNKLVINNFQPCPGCNPGPSPTTYAALSHPERFEGGNIPIAQASPPLTYDKTNTWMLIDNGVNLALNLYNKRVGAGPDFCAAPVQVAGTGAVAGANVVATQTPIDLQAILNQVNNGVSLNQEKDFLQITLYDVTSSQTVACGSAAYLSPGYAGIQRVIPLGAQNGVMPETKLALQIQSTIQFVNQAGVNQQCSASTTLKADGNTVGPQFLWDPEYLFSAPFTSYQLQYFNCTYYNPYICMGMRTTFGPNSNVLNYPYDPWKVTNPPHIFCGNNVTPASAHFAVAVKEPAVTFGCYFQWSATEPTGINWQDTAMGMIGYTPPFNPAPPGGAQFLPCDGSTFTIPGGLKFTTTMTQTTMGPGTKTLPAPTPSPISLTVNTGAVTAAEITANGLPDGWYTIYIRAYDSAQNQSTVAQSFGVDNQRPDKFKQPSLSYNFVPPPNLIKYSAAAPAGLYQCMPSNDMSYWTVTSYNSNSVPEMAPTGARWKIDGNNVNNGRCQSAALVRSTLGPGPHVISAQPCDDCNDVNPAGGPSVSAYPPVTQTWTINTGPGCPFPPPSPTPGPSPSPWPSPSPGASPIPTPYPSPVPFSCCLSGGANCIGAGSCHWGGISTSNYYSHFATGGYTLLPGQPVPPTYPGCANQPICANPPNTGAQICVLISPCPVLFQTGAPCKYNWECASGTCQPWLAAPSSTNLCL